MWFVPFLAIALAAAPPPSTGGALPQAIRTTLDQEYPGWKLAPVTPQIMQTFKKHHANNLPSLAYGDFDHDGKRDYAVQIAITTPGQEEQIVIVFLARGDGYEENILESMGLDPTVYLWVANKDVLMVLGSPVGSASYAFSDGKFQEIKTPEDAAAL